MTSKKVWLITGAGRGLGVDSARVALAAGHAVVATGRHPGKVAAAIGDHEDLSSLELDVTRPEDARAAVAATLIHSVEVPSSNLGWPTNRNAFDGAVLSRSR